MGGEVAPLAVGQDVHPRAIQERVGQNEFFAVSRKIAVWGCFHNGMSLSNTRTPLTSSAKKRKQPDGKGQTDPAIC
jgi:hypothetical protein